MSTANNTEMNKEGTGRLHYKFLILDERIAEIDWKEYEGKYGKYWSCMTANAPWFAEYIDKNGNDRRQVFDLNSPYKYVHNGDWINRYAKTKTDTLLQQQIMERMKEEGVQQVSEVKAETKTNQNVQIPSTLEYAREDSKNDTPEIKEAKITSALRTEAWEKAHAENMLSAKEQINAIRKLSEAVLVLATELTKQRLVHSGEVSTDEELDRLSEEEINRHRELQHRKYGDN